MTFKQIIITTVIGTFVLMAGCVQCFVLGESHPTGPAGKRLHIEMSAYVDKYVIEAGITPAGMQWSTLVLPVLEMDSPAVTYGWALPPKGEIKIWIALFTFHQDMMLMMSPGQRRVVASHEVGHMTARCLQFTVPDVRGLDHHTAREIMNEYLVLTEACADIISAELTSAVEVLDALEFLRDTWYQQHHPILTQRIQVIERVIERGLLKNVE